MTADEAFEAYQAAVAEVGVSRERVEATRQAAEKARLDENRHNTIESLLTFPPSEIAWLRNGHTEVQVNLVELKRMAEFWREHHKF